MTGATHYSKLTVWQLADELRIEVFRLTARHAFTRDLKARGQINDAASSICRNIAEGFGCDSHDEFARYLEIARRSLNEVLDGLRSAVLLGYVTPEDLQPIRRLANRFFPAMSRFIAYLRTTKRQRPRNASR